MESESLPMSLLRDQFIAHAHFSKKSLDIKPKRWFDCPTGTLTVKSRLLGAGLKLDRIVGTIQFLSRKEKHIFFFHSRIRCTPILRGESLV